MQKTVYLILLFGVAGCLLMFSGVCLAAEDGGHDEQGAVAESEHGAVAGGHEATAADNDEEPALLSVDPGTAIWQIVLFVVLLIILGKFVWPQILKGLQAREEKIRSDIVGAQDANKQAQATLDQYQQKLNEAKVETMKMIQHARDEAEKLGVKLSGETEAELLQLRKRAADEIGLAKRQAVEDIYIRAAELATAVAGKILAKQINEADTKMLVEQSLAELDKYNAE